MGRAAADHVDATVGDDGRAVVLPGQLYAYYDWGGTVDAILPALAERPVAVRYAVPYADLRAVDLLWTVDGLVQQRRALPGQLGPLLDLLSARARSSRAPTTTARAAARSPAADAADVLDQLGAPDARLGAGAARSRARRGRSAAARPLPRVRAWDRPGGAADGARSRPTRARRWSTAPPTRSPGSPRSARCRAGRIAYAGDVERGRACARAGEVVISDSNRRRVLAAARMAQNHGATLAADDPFSPDAAVLDLFPARGADAQTVAIYDGARYLRMPFSPAYSQFPERRPFAAFDGDPATHWQADRALEEARHWLEIGFERAARRRRDRAAAVLRPAREGDRGRGRRAARFPVRQGWNRLELGLRDVRSLRVRIAARDARRGRAGRARAGSASCASPACGCARRCARRCSPSARSPAATSTRTGLTYLFERTTGDDPFRRDPRRGTAGADARPRPPGRRARARARRSPRPPRARGRPTAGGPSTARAPDTRDRRAGAARGAAATLRVAPGRFQGRPGFRASSAFDGTPRPWIGSWLDGRTAWLEWTTPRRDDGPRAAARAARARRSGGRRSCACVAGGAATPPLPRRARTARVELPRPLRGRTFRLEILRAAFPRRRLRASSGSGARSGSAR